MKTAEVLLIVVGVAGVGGAVYFATRPRAPAAAPAPQYQPALQPPPVYSTPVAAVRQPAPAASNPVQDVVRGVTDIVNVGKSLFNTFTSIFG